MGVVETKLFNNKVVRSEKRKLKRWNVIMECGRNEDDGGVGVHSNMSYVHERDWNAQCRSEVADWLAEVGLFGCLVTVPLHT